MLESRFVQYYGPVMVLCLIFSTDRCLLILVAMLSIAFGIYLNIGDHIVPLLEDNLQYLRLLNAFTNLRDSDNSDEERDEKEEPDEELSNYNITSFQDNTEW